MVLTLVFSDLLVNLNLNLKSMDGLNSVHFQTKISMWTKPLTVAEVQ